MPMDGFTLSYMRRELLAALQGGRVDKVNQPERDALLLLIRSGGGNHRLLLSANANQARAQLTAQTYENPTEPPMFCMLMRKHLLGARVRDVGQVAGDRILTLVFECLDELGDSVEKQVSALVMASTIRLSCRASMQLSASLLTLTLARPSLMSISKVVPSGMTVRRPSLAACMSFSASLTISASVALAMPSVLGTWRVTGTR